MNIQPKIATSTIDIEGPKRRMDRAVEELKQMATQENVTMSYSGVAGYFDASYKINLQGPAEKVEDLKDAMKAFSMMAGESKDDSLQSCLDWYKRNFR